MDTWGTVVFARKAFKMVEGYNEVMRGWGEEGDDLYERLRMLGLAEGALSLPAFLASISYDDSERMKCTECDDKELFSITNSFYMQAKHIIMWMQGRRTPLGLGVRESLMQHIRHIIRVWSRDPAKPLPSIAFSTAGLGWMPSHYVLHKKGSFTLTLADLATGRSTYAAGPISGQSDNSSIPQNISIMAG